MPDYAFGDNPILGSIGKVLGVPGADDYEGTEYAKNYNADPLIQASSASSVGNSALDSVGRYLDGLFSTVGEENQANRDFNRQEAIDQRDWQADENQKNREWQTYMANTAYQRATNDLKVAGLNPILAATNGATSTPSGVVGSGASASYNVGGGDTFSSILNSISGIASALSGFLPSGQAMKVLKVLGK